MYPYGEEQKDLEMDVELIRDESCKEINYNDGLWFFDIKHYKLFVSITRYFKSTNVFSTEARNPITNEDQQLKGTSALETN